MQIKLLSPWLNHRARKPGTVIDTILLHATAGSTLSGAVETLKERELSYHYLIEKDGTVTKCVPYLSCAYHAGKSVGPQGSGVNEYSVGISFVNMNDGKDPYTAEQTASALALIDTLKAILPLRWLTTHYWVSPGRKNDPLKYPVSSLSDACQLTLWKPRATKT